MRSTRKSTLAKPEPASIWPRNAPPEVAPDDAPDGWWPETRFDIDSRVSMLQRNLRYEMFARLRPLLRHERLTEQQWRVLRTVEFFNFVDHASLCRASGLTRSSMTRILRALALRNLIIYEWPTAKKTGRPTTRHYKVMLTNHAKRLFARARKDAQTRYRDVETKFPERDLEQMCHLMDRFIVALRGAEFGATEETHRSLPHRDLDNGRWISNRAHAKRRELIRAFQEGL
jgi:DNA-binding MarR family transcriptional regulator